MVTKNARGGTSSVDDYTEEALRLTKDFVHHLWARDYSWCINRTTNDFMWIGPKKGQFTITRDEFGGMVESLGAGVRSTVTDEEYMSNACGAYQCCVVGKFLVLTPPDSEQIIAQWHRCTFMWKRVGRRLLLAHLHLSAPSDYVEEGESYPIHAGTETYRYMRSLMKLGSSRNNVSLYDVDGTVHWVHSSQIIYLEASRKRTIVHCMTKDIVVPAVIRDAVDMVGPKFLRVHRSYAVNRDHVVELKAGRLLLDEGTAIAIPAKRIADVRAELAQ
jgi:hypothetical protein